MHPVIKGRQKRKVRQFPFFSCWLNLFLIFGVDIEHSPRHKLATKANPYNLAFQKVSFLAFEVRVGADGSFEISCEDVLNPPRRVNLIWSNDGELLPVSVEQVSGHPVGHFVYSCPFWLHIWWQFPFLTSLSCALEDVVIFRFSQDLTPEFHFFYLLSYAKSFNGFKYNEGSFLSESNSSFLKQFCLFHQVGQISTWPWLLGLLLGTNIGFVEQSSELFSVLFQLFVLLIPIVILLWLSIFDIMGVVLEEVVTIFVIVKNHLFEHLHEVIIGVGIAFFYCLELSFHDLQLIFITYLYIQINSKCLSINNFINSITQSIQTYSIKDNHH